MGRLTGKVALVTGAARGQGRSHAVRMAEEGADVIAVDLCDQIATVGYPLASRDDLDQTVKQVEALDRRIVAEQGDVRDLAAMRGLVERGVAELGPIDIVVANAGIFSPALTIDMEEQAWHDVIDTNLTGVWNIVRAAAPGMVERGAGGSMILISSTAGIKGLPMLGHYTAAKHGVVGLMKSLAQELGPHRIRVNTIHPSSVNTPLVQNDVMYKLFRPDLENPGASDFGELFQTLHLLPEQWVEPRDISNAVVFLASEEGQYITGTQLKVDLGFTEK
ncbi:mycofactocin-coupled SDR family oxidoreductase (plasmid) [Rhodococcus sp. ZPP]|uniref:mycofactocin-coupled SDR family oxidoreductase n=1 Tax=Rhodococcus sp. ZPP TaxID=2749906 RepID=UPI001AD88AFF|nr:mycofactocin-coupled SDR family oxidoreductase [Rhodococcus sp. ZPP]QTJ70246.1 mycofactocin-coupled SDR family oxidoreductase [Rhodococcus sp. ZPP]